MAIYRVQGPDGQIHRFEGPDDATPDQVTAFASQTFGGAAGAPEASAPAQTAQPAAAAPEAVGGAGTRFVRGQAEPILGLGQKVAHGAALLEKYLPNLYGTAPAAENAATYDDAVRQFEGDSAKMAPEGFDVARTAGNVFSPLTLLPGVKAGQLAMKLPLLSRMGIAVPAGAGLAATQPITQGDFGDETAKQIGIGAALGPAAEVIGTGAARTIAPKITDAARALIGEGVRVTPGQALGGVAKTVEEKLMSLPIFGDAIRGARGRGLDDLNRAVANRALAPIGKTLPADVAPGRDLVNHVEDTLQHEYDKLLPKLTFRADMQTAQDLGNVWQRAGTLPESQAKQFDAILQDTLFNKAHPQTATMSGEAFKTVESELSRHIREYSRSSVAGERGLAMALSDVRDALRGTLIRGNPDAGGLRKINQGWANFKRLQDAASSTAAENGIITPTQLQMAVKRGGGKAQFARGSALMQDLSDAAKATLPSKYPDSGTAGRLLLGGGTLGAGAGFFPNALIGLLGASSLYTRPGQYVLRNYLNSGPTREAFANALLQRPAVAGATAAIPAIENPSN